MATPVQGARVHRITLFKVPDPENQQKLVEAYSVLDRDQAKVCVYLLAPFMYMMTGLTNRFSPGRETLHPLVYRSPATPAMIPC